MTKAAILSFYVFISLLGPFQLKAAELGFNFQYLTGMSLYIVSSLLWLVILRWFPLLIAFPLAAGSIIVGTQLAGACS